MGRPFLLPSVMGDGDKKVHHSVYTVSIIILTDGYAPFPKEHLAMGIPVLWLLNNEEVKPPWGKVARIKV